MRALWYLLTVLLGVLGVGGVLRAIEVLVVFSFSTNVLTSLLVGVLFCSGAVRCLKNARAAGT